MNSEIRTYLDKMCREISNKKARENARTEIECHFLDEIEALMASGLTEEESTKKVLAAATPPDKLGEKLNLAYRPFILRYPMTLAVSSMTATLFLVLVTMAHFLVTDYLLPELNAYHDNNYEEAFREDLMILSQDKTLPLKMSFTRDAHPYLFSRFGWGKGPDGDKYETMNKHIESFRYKKKLEKSPWEYREYVDSLKSDPVFLSLEDDWVDELLEYDHLNVFSPDENQKSFAQAREHSGYDRISAVSGYKLMNYGAIKDAIVYRALGLQFQGQSEKADRLLLHAFNLFHTSRIMIGDAIASSILKRREILRKNFQTSWVKVPSRTRLAFRRVSWSWASVVRNILMDNDGPEKWNQFLEPRLSLCSGVSEAQGTASLALDYFKEKAPFETDLDHIFGRYDRRLRKLNELCGFKEFLALQESPVTRPDGLFSTKLLDSMYVDGAPIPLNPARIPYVRRVVGMYFMTVAIPNFWAVYRNKEPEV